jgi:hypothetical protein
VVTIDHVLPTNGSSRDLQSWIRAVLGNTAMISDISVRPPRTDQGLSRITISFANPFSAVVAVLKLRLKTINGSYLRPRAVVI